MRPVGANARKLLESFQRTDGIERFMDYVFYTVAAINGFDSFGHYLRAGLIVNQCANYAIQASFGCSANFPRASSSSAQAATGAPRDQAVAPDGEGAREGARPAGPRGRGAAEEGPQAASAPQRGPGRAAPAAKPTPAPTPAPRRRPQPTHSRRRRRCSTTCSGATSEPARRDRRQPGPDRRRHDPRRAGRGLPGLQRQPGPAVRPDLPAPRRGAERGQPRGRQRRPHRRLARRLRRRHRGRAAGRRLHASPCSTSRSSAASRRCRATRR